MFGRILSIIFIYNYLIYISLYHIDVCTFINFLRMGTYTRSIWENVDVCFHLVMNLFGIDSVFTVDRSKKQIHNKWKRNTYRVCINEYMQSTGTFFIQKIYAPSSSLLQGKYLLFSPSPLRLNIFRLFVILSLTQLYRYTPEIFLFSTATFKYTYRAPPQTNWTRISANVACFIFMSLKRIQPLPVRFKLI